MIDIGWSVSHSDVEKHPLWDGKNLDEVLACLGMDTKRHWEDDQRHLNSIPKKPNESEQFDYFHKNLAGETVKCARYEGFARTDGDWLRAVMDFLDLSYE
jgi:hypothetical protein